MKLQNIFLQKVPEDILIYGIHDIFSKEVKEKFISKNFTWNEIGKIFGFHAKNPVKNLWEWRKGNSGIPLKALRILTEKDGLSEEISKLNLVFGERRSKHKIKIPTLNEDVAYLTGLISGDGNIQLYFIKIVDRFKENLQYAETILKRQFNLPTTLHKESDNKWSLEINSRIVSEFFDKVLEVPIGAKKDIEVPSLIKQANRKIKSAYIRGWMDAEGGIEQWFKTRDKWYLRINFKVKDKKIWNWITNELGSFHIRLSKFVDKENSYRFQISRKESLKLYFNNIGFSYPTKLNKIQNLIKTPN